MIKKIYKINFWLGVSLVLVPLIPMLYIHYILDLSRLDSANVNLLLIKLGRSSELYDYGRVDTNSFILIPFYILFILLFLLPFIISFCTIKLTKLSVKDLYHIKSFVKTSFVFYIITSFIGSIFYLEKFLIGTLVLLFFVFLYKKAQYSILKHYNVYIIFFILLINIGIGVVVYELDNLSVIDYQFYFYNYIDNGYYSKYIFFSTLISPISYIALPLFFSFNHYMSIKKLIMQNTEEEELPKDFYKF